MSLPSYRPASYRLHFAATHADLCADCRGALRRNGFLLHPQGQGEPLRLEKVAREEYAPIEAACTWCV